MMVAVDRLLRSAVNVAAVPAARLLVAIGVSPDALTVIGFLGNVYVASLIGQGQLFWGGIGLILAGIFDTLDGAVAREAKRADRSGALLDSVLDRYSEAVVFLGLLVHFYSRADLFALTLTFMAIIGSLLVSYIRARAEGLNIECRVGIMQRGERIVFLAIGLIWASWKTPLWSSLVFGETPFLALVLGILALLANITAIHRLIFSYSQLQRVHRGQP